MNRKLSGLDVTVTISGGKTVKTYRPGKPFILFRGFDAGTTVTITAKGPDAEKAIDIVTAFIQAGPGGYSKVWYRY
jgi:phosphotransferase system HPr-like phosphotransfer protein